MDLKFGETAWIASLINAKYGISDIFGGHAKIIHITSHYYNLSEIYVKFVIMKLRSHIRMK